MACSAKPNHFQGLRIIGMVLLGFFRSTSRARLALDRAAALVHIGVGSAVHLLALFRSQRSPLPEFAHRFSMMCIAIPAGCPARIAAL